MGKAGSSRLGQVRHPGSTSLLHFTSWQLLPVRLPAKLLACSIVPGDACLAVGIQKQRAQQKRSIREDWDLPVLEAGS